MNFLFWNCKCAAKKNCLAHLKYLIKEHNLVMFTLLCTYYAKNGRVTSLRLRDDKKRILMIWDEERLQAKMVSKHKCISIVFNNTGKFSWILTIILCKYFFFFFYRRNLWNLLASYEFNNVPWILCGDMNIISSHDDKVGGVNLSFTLLLLWILGILSLLLG